MVGRPTGLQVPPPVLRRRLLQDVGQGHARYDGAARREFPDYGAGQACYFENAKICDRQQTSRCDLHFLLPCPTLAENKYFDSFLSEIGLDFDR